MSDNQPQVDSGRRRAAFSGVGSAENSVSLMNKMDARIKSGRVRSSKRVRSMADSARKSGNASSKEANASREPRACARASSVRTEHL